MPFPPQGFLGLISVDGVSNPGGNVDFVAGPNMIITPDNAGKTVTFESSVAGGGVWTELFKTADNTVAPIAFDTGVISPPSQLYKIVGTVQNLSQINDNPITLRVNQVATGYNYNQFTVPITSQITRVGNQSAWLLMVLPPAYSGHFEFTVRGQALAGPPNTYPTIAGSAVPGSPAAGTITSLLIGELASSILTVNRFELFSSENAAAGFAVWGYVFT